jgi:hypothetical protein
VRLDDAFAAYQVARLAQPQTRMRTAMRTRLAFIVSEGSRHNGCDGGPHFAAPMEGSMTRFAPVLLVMLALPQPAFALDGRLQDGAPFLGRYALTLDSSRGLLHLRPN